MGSERQAGGPEDRALTAARLELALQGSGAAPWDWDPRTGRVHRSARVAELAGATPAELGPDLAALVERVHPDDRERLVSACQAVACGERDELQVEYRLALPGGDLRWVRDLGCVVERDPQGRPLRVAGLLLDIDAQRRAEEALRDSEQRLFSLVAALTEGVVYVGADGRMELCNAAAERILCQRAVDLSWPRRVEPGWLAVREDGSPIGDDALPLKSTLRSGQPCRDQLVGLQRPDGSLSWLSVNTQPLIRPGEERPHAVVASFTDVSQRRLAQERLRESEQRFRVVADAAPALIWMTGPGGACTYFNRGGLEFTGRDLEDLVGSGWLECLHPDDRQRCLEAHVSAFERREPFALDFRLRRADGEYRWVSDHGVPRYDAGGRFEGYIGVAVDVTVRKLMAARLEEASEQLSTLVEALPDAVVFKDAAGRWQMANRAAVVLLGLEDVDWRNRTDDQLAALLPQAREGFANLRAADELAWARRGRHDSVDQFADRAGLPVYLEVSRVPLFRSSGERRGLVLLGRNANERRLAEDALLLAASVFEQNREGIMITDAERRILRVNRAFSEITGYSPEEVLGRTPSLLASGRHGAGFYAAMSQSLALTGQWQGEIWNRRKDGEVYPEWLTISTVRSAHGAVLRYVGSFSDVGERKRLEEDRRRLALQDPLTGLPNRALVEETLQFELARLGQPHGRVALVLADVDRFQRLNDSLGYAVGDAVLVALAERLRDWAAGHGLAGRWYGDEFAVVIRLPGESGLAVRDWLALLLTELWGALSRPLLVGDRSLRATLSLGVALAPDDAREPHELVRCAETALRHAKTQGPGACRLHTAEMDTAVRDRIALEEDLERALAEGEFVLWYQPQFEVDSGRLVGAEALVRWSHPRRGLIPPGAFIALAVASGAIVALGQMVLRQACRQLARWRQDGLVLQRVSVNVSGRQLQADFPARVSEALRESGLLPRDLELEITEGDLVDESPETHRTLQQLRELGVPLAIDDFGTGYATFSYLKRFKVDSLKIDRQFVAGLPGDVNDAAIVRSILSLAAGLGLRVVAEGVESLTQARFLALHGCHELQGHLYGAPLDVPAFEAFVRGREA